MIVINNILKEEEDKMKKTLQALKKELSYVRTGRASIAILDKVNVEAYGGLMPLKQLASISVPDPKMIVIQPYDKSLMKEIEKAILKANIGITPIIDSNKLKLKVPSLTQEKRKEVAKEVKKLGEKYKLSIRNIRRDLNDKVKKWIKDSEISEDEGRKLKENFDKSMQKINKEIEKLIEDKINEVMKL